MSNLAAQRPLPLDSSEPNDEGAVALTAPSDSLPKKLLQHENILARAHLLEDLRPHRDADFSKMSFAEQQHQRPRLPNSPTDRKRNLVVQNRLVIRQFHEVELLGHGELLFQGLGRNPDAHRRQFMAALGNGVPY